MIVEGKRWKVHCGDALSVLPGLERNVSLIVTDPPYGIDYQSNWKGGDGWKPIEGDQGTSIVGPILRKATRLYWSGRQHLYVFGEFDITSLPGVFDSVELVWDKESPGMGNLELPWSRSYEHIQFGLARGSSAQGGAVIRKRKAAVLRVRNVTGPRSKRHPTEKPVALLRDLIESSSKFDDVVLDPFMGVGSTGVAAILEGRKFVGIEIEREYFNIAVERLRRAESIWQSQEAA